MTEPIANILNDMERELRCSICLSLIQQATSTLCAHVFCLNCINEKIRPNSTCPLCNQPTKIYAVPHVDVIIQEFKKMKQVYSQEESSLNSTLEDNTLVTSVDIRNAQEREQARQELDTQEISLQKQCRILKKGERPELNVPEMFFVDKVNSQMTHIVLPADEHNIVDRSLTYYLGILHGCYIVNEQWLENCIKKGHIVPENRYEISGDKEMGRTGAPEKGRKNKESNNPNLFKGIRMGIADDNLQRHVEKCFMVGGGVVDDLCEEMIICSDDAQKRGQELKQRFPEKTLVLKEWVFDSICNFELLKMDDYYL